MNFDGQHSSVTPESTNVVLLAGGFGTRLRGHLGNVPKPMVLVRGRPFVEWVIRFLHKQGFSDFVLSTGYLSDFVEKHFCSQVVTGCRVRCVPEEHALGTAGGFLNALDSISPEMENLLVANADSMVLANLRSWLSLAAAGPACAGVLGIKVEDASRYGTLHADSSGWLRGFLEKRPGRGVINAGIYWFSRKALLFFPERKFPLSFEGDVFPTMIARGAMVKVEVETAPFLDIGIPETLQLAEGFIESNIEQF